MRNVNHIPKSSNILQVLILFLNSNDVSFEKIQKLIINSTAEQIIPAFAFLCAWITSKSDSELIKLMSIQSIHNLIDLFLAKASPIILIACIFKQKISFNPPSIILIETFRPILLRFQSLIMITHPLEFNNSISYIFPNNSKIRKKFFSFGNPYFQFECETEPCFHDLLIENIQYLLISHAPLDHFEPFLKLQNSKYILTQAIITLLKKFNNSRKATHIQQLFMFSTLFLYIQSFAERDEIDGQILCEYLRSYPYLSPFCLLGLINHIPKSTYLFNLLIPSKLVGHGLSADQSLEELKNQYSLVDLTLDNTLNNLISFIPNIALSYFLSDATACKAPNKPKTDSDKILFIHQCGSTLTERMKEVIKLAQEGQLNALHVVSMDLLLLKEIVFTFFGQIKEIVTNGKFGKNFYDFIFLVNAFLMPNYGTEIAEKQLSLPIPDFYEAEFIIRSISLFPLKTLLYMPIQNHIIPYAFECLKQNSIIQAYSRFLLNRLIITFSINIDDQFQKCIKECDDILIILSIISYLNFAKCNDYEMFILFQELKTYLTNKIPFLRINQNDKFVTYNSIQSPSENSPINSISKIILNEASNLNYISTRIETLSLLVYSLELQKNRDFAIRLTNFFCEKLSDQTDTSNNKGPFIITVSNLILPSSLELLSRLLIFNFIEEAEKLLQFIRPFVSKDDLFLNWMTPMLSKSYTSLTLAVKLHFTSIIHEYPESSEFFITGDDMAFRITSIFVDDERSICQNPDVIIRPWKSIPSLLLSYTIPAFILGTNDEVHLLESLLLPVFDTSRHWKNRKLQCEFIAIVAAHMPIDIGEKFVLRLLKKSTCPIVMKTIRFFLVHADLELYRKICRDAARLIDTSDAMLKSFMYAVFPSFNRLSKDDETATSLLCGIMQSVRCSTPREVMETVIDLVVLVCIKLRLGRSRGRLINACSVFPPDLRTTFASSLDIESVDDSVIQIPF